MSLPVTLSDTSTVCRTCLKVLDTTGFTYLDDDSGYIKNVGNIREMLQFCVPELDLYVSSKPVICYQCLPILVQVYNFKIKSLNVESSIRAYIARNNLHDYNHVNLNCVLMDDLRIKSQKIQIESRIKHLMLQETDENLQTIENRAEDSFQPQEVFDESQDQDSQESIINPMDIVETGTSETSEQETIERQMKIEIDDAEEGSHDFVSQNQDAYENEESSENQDTFEEHIAVNSNSRNNGNIVSEELKEQPKTIVAVRKDLFGNSVTSEVPEPQASQPTSFILNNGLISQNGRIVIKIDRKKLQNMTVSPKDTETMVKPSIPQQNTTLVVKPPPLTPIQATPKKLSPIETLSISKLASDDLAEPTVSLGEGCPEPQYNCNKCSFVTKDVIKMYDHNRTYHSFDYTCQHCPFSTSKVELLGKHMTMVHPQNMMLQRTQNFKVSENYACSLCPFSVKNVDLLRSHHLTAHGAHEANGQIVLNSAFGDDLIKTEPPKILKRLEYTCDVCPYSTRDKSNLRKHLFTHGTKPLKCDHCSYKCVSPYQLRRHQKQKHAKQADLKGRSQPYKLPELKDRSGELDEFKITLETIKRELEKELTT